MDDGMQGLHPPVHHLGKARQIRHVLDRQTRRRNRRLGAAGGDELDPGFDQSPRRLDEAGLVRHGQKGAPGRDMVGSRRKGGMGHGGVHEQGEAGKTTRGRRSGCA